MSLNIKINVERRVLNQPARRLKLDDQGRMQVKLADGTLVMVTPEELLGGKEDIRVLHDLNMDRVLEKSLEEEVGRCHQQGHCHGDCDICPDV